MAKVLGFVILALLYKFSVGAGRKSLHSPINEPPALQPTPAIGAGICELLVTSQGYTCEEHTVTTSDGYILSLQRIPVGASGGSPGKRTPVLLQHGVLLDGMAWLLVPATLIDKKHDPPCSKRGTMVKYDYNNEGENRSHYGQPNPPDYNVTNIPADFPLFFSYGERDALSDVQDVRFLMDVLKGQNDSRQGKFMAQYLENYAHMDFIMAESAKEQVYDSVLSFNKLH